jgi:hypothetical protein
LLSWSQSADSTLPLSFLVLETTTEAMQVREQLFKLLSEMYSNVQRHKSLVSYYSTCLSSTSLCNGTIQGCCILHSLSSLVHFLISAVASMLQMYIEQDYTYSISLQKCASITLCTLFNFIYQIPIK